MKLRLKILGISFLQRLQTKQPKLNSTLISKLISKKSSADNWRGVQPRPMDCGLLLGEHFTFVEGAPVPKCACGATDGIGGGGRAVRVCAVEAACVCMCALRGGDLCAT